jgi:hypothetical protein
MSILKALKCVMKIYLLAVLLLGMSRVSPAQNVGIGSAAPKAKLHIKGSADTAQLIIDANATQSNTQPLIRLRTASGTDLIHLHSDNPKNTFIGLNAGRLNNVAGGGLNNTFIGALAGSNNSTGYSLTALGYGALFTNTTGAENTAIGSIALYYNTYGYNNTAMGRGALYQNVDGYDNTAIGFRSFFSLTYGVKNTGIGSGALQSSIGGLLNTAVGSGTDVDLPTSSFNTIIGAGARIAGSSSTVIGNGAYTNGNAVAVLGSTTTQFCGGYANWTNYASDARLKNNVSEDVKGLDFIMRLRPVTYYIDVLGIYKRWGISAYGKEVGTGKDANKLQVAIKNQMDKAITDKEAIRMSGFIAQEVEAAAQQADYDFDGIKKPLNDKDNYGLSYATFVVPLVKAMQEQQATIQSQEKELEDLKARLDRIEKQLNAR